MAKQNKSKKQNKMELNKLLFIIPILPLIFAAFAISGPYEYKEFIHPIDIPEKGPSTIGFDFPPMVHFSSNTQHTEIVAVLTAVATDSGDNNGIKWIKIYENNNLIDKKTCNNNPSVCTFSKTITKDFPGTYNYYAKTMDLGENIVQSDTITIVFDGLNHPPQIYNFTPQETELVINVSDSIHFEVWANDPDDDSITYSWTIDSTEVSTTSSWNYQPIIDDAGAVYEVIITVSDGEYEATQTWSVTVLKVPTTCSLNFNPASPINYDQQPFTASCSCTNPEANAELWRNNQDVSTENGQPATLAANPTGYNYICNVSETDHYLASSNSSTYVIEKSQTSLDLDAQPSWNIVYGTETTVTCTANNDESIINLYRNGMLVNNPDVQTLSAGTYNYTCDASESENWTASSAANALNIIKAPSAVNLLLNNTDGDITVVVGESVEMNGMLIMPSSSPDPYPNPDDDIMFINQEENILSQIIAQTQMQIGQKQGTYHVELLLDSQRVAYGEHNVNYITSFDNAGTYNATVFYPETGNYSSSFETHFITVEEDTEAPVVNLISPADGTIFTIPNVTIIYNVTDDFDTLIDCNIWSSTSGTWQIDAQQQTANGSSNNWTYSSLDNGVYIWNIECGDEFGNIAFAPSDWIFTINVDYEAPVITFVPPTPLNDSTITINSTFINTTITDNVAVDNAILEWNGINETMSELGTNYYVNKTDLNDGIYTYTVYANDTLNNWNVSETKILTVDTTIQIHDIAIEVLDLQKDANSQGINKSIELSTVYLNDTVYVLVLVHNLGNVDETNINIILQNNIGIIDSKLIDLDAGESDLVVFTWNAYPEGWHTVTVRAESVQGETDLTNNELSEDAQVWEVCKVIDCSVFGPKTAFEKYTLDQPFLVRSLIQNLWNDEGFKDLKIELDVEEPGLGIIAPWPAVQYIDNLAPSQFVAVNWNVTSYNRGDYSITAWAGNREYSESKNIEIE